MRIALVDRRLATAGQRRRPHADGGRCGELGKRRPRGDAHHPDLFRTLPCPTYPEIRLALAPAARRPAARGRRARRHPHRHRGTARAGGAALVPEARLGFTTAYHTRFPEYCRGALSRAAVPGATRCCGAFTRRRAASWWRRDSVAARARGARLRQSRAVDARRRSRRSSTRRCAAARSACRGRSSSPSAASPSRRTSRPSSRSTCRDRKW